jgi:superfamily II DNA or RNA helicase
MKDGKSCKEIKEASMPKYGQLKESLLRGYNGICLRTGVTCKKRAVLLFDFDNKNDDKGVNGLILYNKFIYQKVFDKDNNYIESTGGGGRHLIVFCDDRYLNSLKSSCTGFDYENIHYHADVKANNQFSIIAPTIYKSCDGKDMKYEVICDKINPISEKLREIVLTNMRRTMKKHNIKLTKTIKPDTQLQNNNTDIKYLEQIVKLINPKRADSSYEEWISIGMALKNENTGAFKIFDDFSKQSKSKYDGSDKTLYIWNNLASLPNYGYSIGTLKMLAKLDSPDQYKKLLLTIEDPKINETLQKNKNTLIVNQKYISNDYFSEKEESDLEINKMKKVFQDFVYGDIKTITIKSPMGTGKTICLTNLIKSNDSLFVRILMVTHRIDFSNSIYGVFKELGFKHYKHDKTEIALANRVIVSIDSLYKIFNTNARPFDLIILDEIESLLYHFSSKTLDGSNEFVFSGFLTLCRISKKILLSDADFNLRAFNFVSQLEKEPNIIYNIYNNNKKVIKLNFDENVLVKDIYDKINLNKNVVVICQSITKANNLHEKLSKEFKDKTIVLHTSKTPDDVKQKLVDVNEFWSKMNILIYTSTIECGIDFNKEHFDNMYVFTTSRCNSPRSLIQQMGRIRKLNCNEILFHIGKEFKRDINCNSLYSFVETKEYIDHSFEKTNDIFVYNKQEELNKLSENFLTKLIQCCNESNFKYIYNQEKSDKKLFIENKEQEVKRIKELCKNLNTENHKEIFIRVENNEGSEEDKFKCEVLKLMKKLKLDVYDDIIIDNFYGNKRFENLLILLTDTSLECNNLAEQESYMKANHIKSIIKELGFSLSENRNISNKAYNENIIKFFESNYYKKLNMKDFNILFELKKRFRFNKKTCYFNKQIKKLMNEFGIDICKYRQNHKKIKNITFSLCYMDSINEIILNLGKQLHITPFKPNKNIYEKLKFDQEVNILIFN